MSVASRQKTCAVCGKDISSDQNINVEPLVDNNVRYVVTHWDCCTFVHHDHSKRPHLTDQQH